MAPLPYTDSGAKIAFYVVFGLFVVLESRVRLRSILNRASGYWAALVAPRPWSVVSTH